ncbi:tyrosine-type recombinase/integrase [Parasporobacterium paucivorans]|uniref:Phage integrase, N-terminal SAM-like domain n=1 Tax=Parasporobacterium paucivorans DSM 15970 TaxID=1122934 RepID=A0A1M6F249_9FIRM|nr:site-specific integrase [Parasporobacterium paucivorans]SHI91741.1 Phage integrase, N-terminal SAM-like domain [Parasporobacterium paucivorans DSM 15970]
MATNKKASRKDQRGVVLPQNISQLTDLRYIWRKSVDGKSHVLVDSNLGELKKRVIQKEADIQNGVVRNYEKITLNDWFEKWLTLYKARIKISTRTTYQNYWDLYIKDSEIGNLQISKIKRPNIVQTYETLVKKHNLSYNTLKYINAIMNTCLKDAVEDKLIIDNPCTGALKKIKKNDCQKRISLTLEEQAKFIDFISNSNYYKTYLPFFSFMLGTGCRIGEATGLTWDDVDLKNNTVYVNHTLSYLKITGKYDFYITTPKTESSNRYIPIIEDLRKQLIQQKEAQFMMGIDRSYKIDGYSGFVFTSHVGRPFTISGLNRTIISIVEAHNRQEQKKASEEKRTPVLLPKFTSHTLRHTFCTRFCENENNIKAIQQIMGHAKISTTMDIYSHVTKEKAEEVMQNLSGKIKIC